MLSVFESRQHGSVASSVFCCTRARRKKWMPSSTSSGMSSSSRRVQRMRCSWLDRAHVGHLPVENHFHVSRSLELLKIMSSMRLPVSIKAEATMVRLPSSSVLRAAAKVGEAFLGPGCRGLQTWFALDFLEELWARAKRVIESIKMTTSLPVSTSRWLSLYKGRRYECGWADPRRLMKPKLRLRYSS